MKFVLQAGIIFGVSFIGELLNTLIPLPIPGSVYGVVLLFLLLSFRIIKLEWVEGAGNFFLTIMPFLFISPNVSLMNSFGILKDNWFSLLLLSLLSTIVVMIFTSGTAQLLLRLKKSGGHHE